MIRFPCLLVLLGLAFLGQPCRAADGPVAKTFDSKGVKIRYSVEGKGEPVVLIHGLLSSAAINWQLPGICKHLAKRYRVIALDVRGHGGSDKPEKDEAYGIELVEDVVRLLDHLKIQKVHVVGYSMGGIITMKLLAKHPKRVLSAVVGGMGWLRSGSLLQKVFERMDGGCARSLAKLAVTEAEIKAIRVPVAILVGDRDPCKQMYVEPLKKVRKDWTVIEISDAGHLNCILKAQFKEEIAKQLARLAKR